LENQLVMRPPMLLTVEQASSGLVLHPWTVVNPVGKPLLTGPEALHLVAVAANAPAPVQSTAPKLLAARLRPCAGRWAGRSRTGRQELELDTVLQCSHLVDLDLAMLSEVAKGLPGTAKAHGTWTASSSIPTLQASLSPRSRSISGAACIRRTITAQRCPGKHRISTGLRGMCGMWPWCPESPDGLGMHSVAPPCAKRMAPIKLF